MLKLRRVARNDSRQYNLRLFLHVAELDLSQMKRLYSRPNSRQDFHLEIRPLENAQSLPLRISQNELERDESSAQMVAAQPSEGLPVIKLVKW